MKRTFELVTEKSCKVLRVREVFVQEQTVIYVPKEAEVFVGWQGRTMADAGWPQQLQKEVNHHFDTAFSFPHEKWKPTTIRDLRSPREWYLAQRPSWTVITNEGEK